MPSQWTAEDQANADWLLKTKDAELPTAPFKLCAGQEVVDAAKFYAALRMDASKGGRGTRALTGALQEDLRRVRERRRME